MRNRLFSALAFSAASVAPVASLWLCWGLTAQAQLLNGDFSAGNTNFSSDYRFDPTASYLPGYYTIQTNSQLANYNYAKFGDHTTGTGQMLLADGHTISNKLVWTETVLTSTNTPYVFSAWATSSGAGSNAVLRFLVNNNQLGPDFPLATDAGRWQQFIFVWNSGPNTQATLGILDTNLVYVGNDFALDDLSFEPVTNTVAAVSIYPAVELGWDSVPGEYFQVQTSTSADTNLWLNLGPAVQSTGAVTYFFDTTRDQLRKFYRVLPLK